MLHENKEKNFFAFPHNRRNCVYDEAEAVIKLKYDNPFIVHEQMEHYRRLGLPKNAGLNYNGVLLRKHNDPEVKQLDSIWYDHVLHFSKRDQLSLNFVAWKINFTFGYFEGTIKNNEYVVWPGFPNQIRIPRNFNDEKYLILNPEVAASNMEPREHFIKIGSKIGLSADETEALENLSNSRAWKFIKAMRKFLRKVAPLGSLREKFLNKILRSFGF